MYNICIIQCVYLFFKSGTGLSHADAPFLFSVQVIETSILIRNGLLLLTGEESRLSLRYVGGFDSVVFLRVSVIHRTVVWLV